MKLFCTGAVTDWDDPLGWHDEVREEYTDHEVLNPYELGDDDLDIYKHPERVMEPAVEAVTESDGVIAHWDDGVNLPGSVVYMREAMREGIPVVVWYSGSRPTNEVSPAIKWLSQKRIYPEREKSIDVLLALGGDTTRFHLDG